MLWAGAVRFCRERRRASWRMQAEAPCGARCCRGTSLAARAFQSAFFRFFTEVCWRVLRIGGVSGEKVKDIPQNNVFCGISLSVEVDDLRTSVKNAHIFVLRRPKGGVSEGEAFGLLAESFAPVCHPRRRGWRQPRTRIPHFSPARAAAWVPRTRTSQPWIASVPRLRSWAPSPTHLHAATRCAAPPRGPCGSRSMRG